MGQIEHVRIGSKLSKVMCGHCKKGRHPDMMIKYTIPESWGAGSWMLVCNAERQCQRHREWLTGRGCEATRP